MKQQRYIFAAMSLGVLLSPCILFATHTDENLPWYRRYWSNTVTRQEAQLDDQKVDAFVIPILFGVTLDDITPNFGDPRSGGRTHEGLDMLAPIGTPIISPTEAVVTHITYGESAGHSVYTANPGDETFVYLHLDRVNPLLEVGDLLQVGDLIGYVGDTGNAKGGPAHLHFEVLDNNGANDPYPRISKEISSSQKEVYYKRMLSDLIGTDKDVLQTFIATVFPEEFEAMTGASAQVESGGDLTLGAEGDAVVALQQYLIAAQQGPQAIALADIGPTGYFGDLTKDALQEFQERAGISPATGYYGPATRQYMRTHIPTPVAVDPVILEPTPTTPSPQQTVSGAPTSNLTNGSMGEDVVWLQEFLIARGSGDAIAALRAVGATGYFGSLTERALAEYQKSVGISPAIGYYGPVTRSYITGQ